MAISRSRVKWALNEMRRFVSASELILSVLTHKESVTAVQLFAVRDAIRRRGIPVERIDFHKISRNNSSFTVANNRLCRGDMFSPVEIAEDIYPAISKLL